jgi:hypothetical protein
MQQEAIDTGMGSYFNDKINVIFYEPQLIASTAQEAMAKFSIEKVSHEPSSEAPLFENSKLTNPSRTLQCISRRQYELKSSNPNHPTNHPSVR